MENQILLLEKWFGSIREFSTDYIKSKIEKTQVYKSFKPEVKMARMIRDFNNKSGIYITGTLKNLNFSMWSEAKGLHLSSKTLAKDVQKNGFKSISEFIGLIEDYISSFSSEFSKLADEWDIQTEIKYNVG